MLFGSVPLYRFNFQTILKKAFKSFELKLSTGAPQESRFMCADTLIT